MESPVSVLMGAMEVARQSPQRTSHAPTQPHCPPTQPSPMLPRPTDCLILLFTLAALLGLVGRGGGIHNQLAATRWGAPLAALLGDAS